MKSFTELLEENRGVITQRLYLGYDWDKLMPRVRGRESARVGGFKDEQAWTFLAACGYAMGGAEGVARLTKTIIGADMPQQNDAKIWFEVSPLTPRKPEGPTHLDLALGTITRRESSGRMTKSGIKLAEHPSPWISFCEMKWDSDMSARVTHDPHRNQLVRVIENALCFQSNGRYADNVHMVLVTSEIPRNTSANGRTYRATFQEYKDDHTNVLNDLNSSIVGKRSELDWTYPADMAERVNTLFLHWHTYSELFENIPDSAISGQLKEFWDRFGG